MNEAEGIYDELILLAGKILRGSDLAEDAVQTAYLAYYERVRAGEVIEKPEHLLRSLVRNKAVDLVRQESRHEEISEDLSDGTPMFGGVIALDRGMKNLTPRRRRAFELVMRQGLTQAEAAGKMGVSEKGVSRLLSKAVKQLRRDI